jgi:hypothetical protein
VGADETEWHHFRPGLEPKPKVLTADLCSACNARCWAGAGEEFCISQCEYDPAVMMGAEIGRTVLCICACHTVKSWPARPN